MSPRAVTDKLEKEGTRLLQQTVEELWEIE